MSILEGPDGIVHAAIEWEMDCQMPRAIKSDQGLPLADTLLTLPIPPEGETFFLFGIPSENEGNVYLHIQDTELLVPLDKLHDAEAKDEDQWKTRSILLVEPSRESAGVVIPCKIKISCKL